MANATSKLQTTMKKALLLLIGLASTAIYAQDPALYRTIDGTMNNLQHPDWGAANTTVLHIGGANFADGIGAPNGADRPNPRRISNIVFSQPDLLSDPMNLSDYTWVFGQFLDHDLSFTIDGAEPMDIDVPIGDPHFDPLGFGTVKIRAHRNQFVGGTDVDNPRQFPNIITAFIDGSGVYGSDQAKADWLRSFEGGKLKVSAGNMMPYNTSDGELDSPIDLSAPHMDDAVGLSPYHFVAGDARANENPLLAAFHTIFVREHNRQCDLLAQLHPDWTDEQLYQHARKLVSGVLQSIVYNEWLPVMGVDLPPYTGYNPEVHPQLSNTFTAAAFRLGHTLLNSNLRRVDYEGNVIPEGHLSLRDAFFNIAAIRDVGGLDPYLMGMAQQTQQKMDNKVVDDVRNFLFGPPGAGGLDLPAINIARGRERGLPTFNQIRQAYGLAPVSFFAQINADLTVYTPLFEAYFGNVNRLDPWVGMLAEKPVAGKLFGPTILAILRYHFAALRDGDRFFYLNDPVLSETEKDWIHHATFREIIMHNTSITLMQDNVFLSTPYEEICNNMTASVSGNVRVHTSAADLPNVQINLLQNGEAVNNSLTGQGGNYIFNDLAACETVGLSAQHLGDNWINGITVADIVAISRHILGLDTINSPYQLLAADADNDGAIRVTDIIALRRLILGIDQQLAGDLPQWGFVPANYIFNNPASPWSEDYPSIISLNTPSLMMANHHFIAYKRGDVNASALINNNFQNPDLLAGRSNQAALYIEGEDLLLKAGETVQLSLALASTEAINGYQFSLAGQGAQLLEVQEQGLNADFFHLSPRGTLRFCGEQLDGQKRSFLLSIRSEKTALLSEVLQIQTQEMPAIALNEQRENRGVAFNWSVAATQQEGMATRRSSADLESNALQAYPNPFSETLQLDLPAVDQATQAFLSLYDAQGRLVLHDQLQLNTATKEASTWRIPTTALSPGLYSYQVNIDGEQFSGQLLKH